VNLGFKDVNAVLQIVAAEGVNDPKSIIAAYEKQRRLANLAMMSTMDVLYQGFSSSFAPLRIARGIGLAVADKAGPVKKMALKYAMGLA
jgi:2-octaprenyl-3-methyl-6-methoxy-1,4-benzoquinol hydroxylase